MENQQRDYDKDPIVIKSKREIYSYFSAIVIFLVSLIYIMIDKNLSFYEVVQERFVSFVICLFGFCIFFYKAIMSYKNGETIYKFTNNEISYSSHDYYIVEKFDDIVKINNILLRNYTHGYNQYQDRTLFQMLFKTDILELFFYIIQYIIIVILNVFVIFPYRILFARFYLDLIIHFKDEYKSFIVIFVDTKKEHDEIIEYLEFKKLKIEKTQFIQLVQEEDIFKNFSGDPHTRK